MPISAANVPILALHLAAYSRGHRLTTADPVTPAIAANRASYAHGNVTEWWRVLPVGFEQGFTLARRPAGHGELVLALASTYRRPGATAKDAGYRPPPV